MFFAIIAKLAVFGIFGKLRLDSLDTAHCLPLRPTMHSTGRCQDNLFLKLTDSGPFVTSKLHSPICRPKRIKP